MNHNCQVSRIRSNPHRDEFYTTHETAKSFIIESGLCHCLAGKRVVCNADGPESEIFKLLVDHFVDFKLASLEATQFKLGGRGVYSTFDPQHGVETALLVGDGSYESQECRDIWTRADIVVTNPPFSSKCFIKDMLEASVDYAIIMNPMFLAYRDVFQFAVNGQVLDFGKSSMTFITIDGTVVKLPFRFFTNIEELSGLRNVTSTTLAQLEARHKIQRDDETGILNVNFVRDIPSDITSEFFAPITALSIKQLHDKFNFHYIKRDVVVSGSKKFIRVVMSKKNSIIPGGQE